MKPLAVYAKVWKPGNPHRDFELKSETDRRLPQRSTSAEASKSKDVWKVDETPKMWKAAPTENDSQLGRRAGRRCFKRSWH